MPSNKNMLIALCLALLMALCFALPSGNADDIMPEEELATQHAEKNGKNPPRRPPPPPQQYNKHGKNPPPRPPPQYKTLSDVPTFNKNMAHMECDKQRHRYPKHLSQEEQREWYNKCFYGKLGLEVPKTTPKEEEAPPCEDDPDKLPKFGRTSTCDMSTFNRWCDRAKSDHCRGNPICEAASKYCKKTCGICEPPEEVVEEAH